MDRPPTSSSLPTSGGAGAPQDRASLRLVDLLAAISLVTDLGMANPPESAMGACLLATRLAGRMGLRADQVSDIYYTALLRYLGCTAYAHEEAAMFGGDDLAGRALGAKVDFANPREAIPFLLTEVGRGTRPVQRLRAVAQTLQVGTELARSHCEVGAALARRLGLSAGVQQGLARVFERWDGKGAPAKLAGEAVALPARVAQVATQAALFVRLGGIPAACDEVRRRGGGALDPAIAAVCLRHGPALLAEIAATDVWQAVLDAEPAPQRRIPASEGDAVARACGDMVDLKLPFTRGHAAGVAVLAEGAARVLGMSGDDVAAVRRVGLLHDLGRVGIPNGIWEKPGALTTGEWERVRLHPYHTERILARSPVLAPLAVLAGMHHERQDGSGYHRQATGAAIPPLARLLAAADAYQAMTQMRPYRPAHPPEAAAHELAAEAAQGRLDPAAVRAVLAAAGHRPLGQRAWPAGLSDREVAVLRLIAHGSSYRDVGSQLSISPKTAEHHIEHVYAKIDVSTRAAAAMFAMEHGLV